MHRWNCKIQFLYIIWSTLWAIGWINEFTYPYSPSFHVCEFLLSYLVQYKTKRKHTCWCFDTWQLPCFQWCKHPGKQHSLVPSPSKLKYRIPGLHSLSFFFKKWWASALRRKKFNARKAGNYVSELPYFKIFWGSMPLDPPCFEGPYRTPMC